MKKYIVGIITCLLVLSTTSYSIASNVNLDPQTKPKPNVVPFICGVAVALSAIYVVYSVYLCCQSAGLTSPPPPPAPPGTNAPNNNISFSPHDDLIPPDSTNTYAHTNIFVPVSSLIYPNTILATNNDTSMEAKQDISTNGWTDWQGYTYTWFFTTQTDPSQPHVQTSTNLVDWADANYSVNMWFSSSVTSDPSMSNFTNMVAVIYDGNGAPLVTNWCHVTTNAPIKIGFSATAPQMFFRGVTP